MASKADLYMMLAALSSPRVARPGPVRNRSMAAPLRTAVPAGEQPIGAFPVGHPSAIPAPPYNLVPMPSPQPSSGGSRFTAAQLLALALASSQRRARPAQRQPGLGAFPMRPARSRGTAPLHTAILRGTPMRTAYPRAYSA